MPNVANKGSGWLRDCVRFGLLERSESIWGYVMCVYCECDLTSSVGTNRCTIDHVIPCASGGSNAVDNLVVACKSCNSKRQDKPLDSWATAGQIERIYAERMAPVDRIKGHLRWLRYRESKGLPVK